MWEHVCEILTNVLVCERLLFLNLILGGGVLLCVRTLLISGRHMSELLLGRLAMLGWPPSFCTRDVLRENIIRYWKQFLWHVKQNLWDVSQEKLPGRPLLPILKLLFWCNSIRFKLFCVNFCDIGFIRGNRLFSPMKKNVLLNFFYVYNILHILGTVVQQDKPKSNKSPGLHQKTGVGDAQCPPRGYRFLSALVMYYSRTFIEKLKVKWESQESTHFSSSSSSFSGIFF